VPARQSAGLPRADRRPGCGRCRRRRSCGRRSCGSKRAGAARIAEDVDTADLSGVTGTPTFFINGRRHYGSYDITALTSAVLAAKAAATASR
jgi:hypothetical protein